ncbi:MAG: hypothetical protein ACJ8FO_06680 [Sphingomicrobium sp.]
MIRRQTAPRQWLIVDTPDDLWPALRRLERRSGVLVLAPLDAAERRRLRHIAGSRALTVVAEQPRSAVRVHNSRELRQALLRRTPLILLSPIHRTSSHPDWHPLPRMRAAAFARLAGRRLFALGGMNRERYAKIAPLGFIGWTGISAFRT